MLRPLFPDSAIVAELREEADQRWLLPAEAEHLGRAVPKRAREYTAGRLCARRALAEFGMGDFALRTAPDRRPLWPAAYVGSITHTRGFCGAVVAPARLLRAVGLDTEIVGAPTPELYATICGAQELAWVLSQRAEARDAAVTLIFSAKEAFYKCQYPLTGEWLDFHDLEVKAPAWDGTAGAFSVTPLRTLRFDGHAAPPVAGRYLVHAPFLSCGIAVDA